MPDTEVERGLAEWQQMTSAGVVAPPYETIRGRARRRRRAREVGTGVLCLAVAAAAVLAVPQLVDRRASDRLATTDRDDGLVHERGSADADMWVVLRSGKDVEDVRAACAGSPAVQQTVAKVYDPDPRASEPGDRPEQDLLVFWRQPVTPEEIATVKACLRAQPGVVRIDDNGVGSSDGNAYCVGDLASHLQVPASCVQLPPRPADPRPRPPRPPS